MRWLVELEIDLEVTTSACCRVVEMRRGRVRTGNMMTARIRVLEAVHHFTCMHWLVTTFAALPGWSNVIGTAFIHVPGIHEL